MPRGKTCKTKYREKLIYIWAMEHHPVTVRQLFYRLSVLDAVPKNESGCKTVGRICAKMRRDGELPFEWIADNTRWQRKPRTYNSLEDALTNTAQTYRRNLWQSQQGIVEIWLEKDALAGVVYPVTAEWDVPLMVVKGYPSLSFTHSAAQDMHKATEQGKTNHIFYFGDHDPSGKDIFRCVGETLREFAPAADINMKQVAVTEQQIADWDLPSRTTKRTDSRSKNFIGDSVELDAIPPAQLRQLVQDSIFSIMDSDEMEKMIDIETAEQESISQLISGFSKSGLAPF